MPFLQYLAISINKNIHVHVCQQISAMSVNMKQDVIDTTLCEKVYWRLVTGQWFSPVSFTNKTEILLKAVLSTLTPNPEYFRWVRTI